MSKIAKIFTGNIDQALEKWPKHLFIKNACADNMTLLINLKDASNTTVTIKFPKTWVPVDVLDYVDANSALKSSQLRGMLRSGNLKIVDADSALEILALPEAHEEAKRCHLTDFGSPEANGEEKVEVISKDAEVQAVEIDKDFYSIRKFALEGAENADDAYTVALEVYSNYMSEVDDEKIKDEELTKKITSIKEVAANLKFKDGTNASKATEKIEEILKFIEENK